MQNMEKKNIYSRNGIGQVINASGRMTKLGVSTISDAVAQDVVDAAQNYVVIDKLLEWAGKKIGSMIGCADACVTSSASAGIAMAVSSLICKNKTKKIEHHYKTIKKETKREVIVLKGHAVNFGAPVLTMIALGGGEIVEVGYANRSDLEDLEEAVNENTVAIVFVQSHHCVQKNMLEVEEVVKFANEMNIPCIVDAAAEEDLSKYINMGADLVCYSGAKAICGPTSGFVACKTVELADNMRKQYLGIGRAMKVGKENIMGLVKAIEQYQAQQLHQAVSKEELEAFIEEVNQIPGLQASLSMDEAGREIYRAKIVFGKAFGKTAKQVRDEFIKQEPSIYVRDHQANLGILFIDPRPLLSPDELRLILVALQNQLVKQ